MTSTPTEKGARKANARKFYIMDPDPRVRSVGGFEIENLRLLLDGRRVLGPPPSQRGFANSPEPPRLLIDRALGRAPLDLEQYHQYWLVSDRMKNILESMDPESVAFVRCETRYPDRTEGAVYWLCDVIRVLDAVDEEKSRLKVVHYPENNSKTYSLVGGAELVFKTDVVGTARLFRARHMESYILCDQQLRDACKNAGVKGLAFMDAAEL